MEKTDRELTEAEEDAWGMCGAMAGSAPPPRNFNADLAACSCEIIMPVLEGELAHSFRRQRRSFP